MSKTSASLSYFLVEEDVLGELRTFRLILAGSEEEALQDVPCEDGILGRIQKLDAMVLWRSGESWQ